MIWVWDPGRWLNQRVSKGLALILPILNSVKSLDLFSLSQALIGLKFYCFLSRAWEQSLEISGCSLFWSVRGLDTGLSPHVTSLSSVSSHTWGNLRSWEDWCSKFVRFPQGRWHRSWAKQTGVWQWAQVKLNACPSPSHVGEMSGSGRNWREHAHSVRARVTQFQPIVM